MNSIVTFYSYKGGVGRSMALANIAFELSRKGLRILIVDWDLEAPGLERYFSKFEIEIQGYGLLPLLMEVQKGLSPTYEEYLWKIKIPGQPTIDFLHSGREKDNNYSSNLENFEWDDFFSKGHGGKYLEKLRSQWKKDYDIVLIDSRTGLSDTSGICTIFLPDIIVPMFTANYQSLYGVRDIMRLSQKARQKLASSRMPLTILPVPTRFGTRGEFKESQEWLDRFAEDLKEFYSDWLPKWISPKKVLERIKVPQIDYFSFGEKLAVVEHGTNDPEGMGYIFSKIATLLASDFKDIESFMGEQYNLQKEEHVKEIKIKDQKEPIKKIDYEYDIFISYAGSSITSEWISKQFLPLFKNYLDDQLPWEPKIFFDIQEINLGDSFSQEIEIALKHSKVMVPILTPKYLRSRFAISEFVLFEERQNRLKSSLIFPVVISGLENLRNSFIYNFQLLDLTAYNFIGEAFSRSTKYLEFGESIRDLTKAIAKVLVNIPPLNLDLPSLKDKYIQEKVETILKDQPPSMSLSLS